MTTSLTSDTIFNSGGLILVDCLSKPQALTVGLASGAFKTLLNVPFRGAAILAAVSLLSPLKISTRLAENTQCPWAQVCHPIASVNGVDSESGSWENAESCSY